MPRYARMIIPDEKAVYHVMTRTALDGLPFGDLEKDEFVRIIRVFSKIYFTEILGFAIMGNHIHIVLRMFPDHYFTDTEIKKRFQTYYGEDSMVSRKKIKELRDKWSSLSEYMKDVKQTFSRYYNKLHDRRGTLWGERFKSLIVENGETLINCLAYVDLNAVRAGIVERPEEYRWCSLGYHIQTGNKDNWLSLDFGLKEFGIKSKKERLRLYRKYVYETGAVDVIGMKVKLAKEVIEKERKKGFEITRSDLFKQRTRYFTDSGIIGSKEFVQTTFQNFKNSFQSKNERVPRHVKGLDGIYSMKRLSEKA